MLSILISCFFASISLFGQAQFPLEEVAVSDNIDVLTSEQIQLLSQTCKDFY